MKSKHWAAVLVAFFAVCIGLTLMVFQRSPSQKVEVLSQGKRIQTLDLSVDQQLTVDTGTGINVITVRGGKIAVTEASCPDHICMARGFCNSGPQIVCLPNGLVIRFLENTGVDGAVG